MTDIDSRIARVYAGYKSAVYAKDAAAFVRWYDPQVRVFDMWGVWSYEGLAAWQGAVEAWFASLGAERVAVDFEQIQALGTAELAAASAMVTYAGLSASGQPLRAMRNRISWVLKAGGDGLQIVHEHSSAPVGMADLKVLP